MVEPVRIVILGGGFGGVAVAQELEKLVPKLGRPVEVTLVSQSNYLLFVPMLPSAAAASVELTHILSPLREILRNTRIRVETVETVDLKARTVTTTHPSTHREQVIPWDHLVIALGNVVNLARLPGVAQHGLPIKTIGDALQIRNRTVGMLEAAENTPDPELRRQMLTFVVAGGGYSGVEVAAEVNDFVREAERECYPVIQPEDVRVILLHSGQRILPEISESLARFAHRELSRRGVEVRLGARLASATADHVTLESGERIDTHTLIVAIGAAPNPVVQQLNLPLDRGRIHVDETLRVAGHASLWALGDCAAVPLPKSGNTAPPTAQFAMREGKVVARNIAAAVAGRPGSRFSFTGLGEMVSLGRGAAVAELLGRVKLAGFPAWVMWRTFYLMRLPGLERKIRVWLDWNLDRIFRRDLVQLSVQRTERVAHAHYAPGQAIIQQGDLADAFYVIVRGTVEVIREGEDGQETSLAHLGAGDSFGELGLLQHRRRSATVRAIEPVDVIVLGRSDFDLLAGTWKNLNQSLEEVARARTAPSDE